jgi:hypothetical protein
MALHARERISRRSWLLAGLGIPLFRAWADPLLRVTSDGDNLHVAAPQLHFLTGRPLARLKDGNVVVFLSQLTLFRDDHNTVIRRKPERITVSYDLWEEKFQVGMAEAATGAQVWVDRRSASRLSIGDTEAWCMENLAISALGLETQRPFWLRFELRTASEKEVSAVAGDTGISIRGLIEMFSRRAGADQPHWELNAGPLRLGDLPRTTTRRIRIG